MNPAVKIDQAIRDYLKDLAHEQRTSIKALVEAACREVYKIPEGKK